MIRTMKALVKSKSSKGIWLEEVPVPNIGPKDVLVKIKRTAICGTDMHIYEWNQWAKDTIPVPMVIGHEFVGEVAAVGSSVDHIQIGTLVSGEGHLVCGTCRNCLAGRQHLCPNTKGIGVNRDGAFAEYLSIPASNIFICDPSMDERIYSFFDPYGNAIHTALSFTIVGEDVLVTGGGPIGIMSALVAIRSGARYVVLTEPNPYRINLAKKMGIEHVIDPTKTSLKEIQDKLGMKEGFDVGLETSGNERAFASMIDNMATGGKISLLGLHDNNLQINWSKVIFGCLTIKGIYGREMYDTWYKMEALLKSGLDLSKLITHEFDIQDFQKGFDIMETAECGKVILNWNS